MKVLLARPRGFCAGVERAVAVVEAALRKHGSPVYIKHALVHNWTVVRELEAKGAVTVEHPSQAPPGAVIVFSAHGSPPEDYRAARKRGQTIIDATCPLVAKVHNEARRYAAGGYRILYIGHRDHVEPRGVMGYASMELLDSRRSEDVREVLSRLPADSEVAVLTQTTLSVDDARATARAIEERFPRAIIRRDICYATTNRQTAVKELVRRGADPVLVIGSGTSSNAQRMREVAEAQGVSAFLIEGPEELPPLAGRSVIGVSSGASTPESTVETVLERLCALYQVEIEEVVTRDEEVRFKEPEV